MLLPGSQIRQVSSSCFGQRFRSESVFLERGRLSGAVLNEGTDVLAGPVFGVSQDDNVGLSYLSFVLPSESRRWTLAGFRHEVIRIDDSFSTNGVFQQDPSEFTSRREFPQVGIRRVSITNYAASGAYVINPRISVGGTISLYRFKIDSLFRRFHTEGFLGPPVLSEEAGRSSQAGTDASIVPTAGVQVCIKPCEDRRARNVRVGAVYRRGPTFQYTTVDGPNRRTPRFRVPDVFAAGAMLEIPRDTSRLQFSAEVTRVAYSRLRDDWVTDQAVATGRADNFLIDDGTEVHVGVQYSAVSWRWVPKLRAGIWTDPDHSVRYRSAGPSDFPTDRLFDEHLASALSEGGGQVHLTGGLGLSISPRFEWNIGADFADSSTVISSSVIVRLRD
jgi:long-chain fatty acid transport protein